MKLLKAAGLVLGIAVLVGCAPRQSPVGVVSASRSDGTVTVGYRANNIWGGLENKVPAFVGGLGKAVSACQKWGYANADELDDGAFGYTCQQNDPIVGCMTAQYTKVYQCVGNEPGAVHK